MKHIQKTHKVFHDGRSMGVYQWADELGISVHTIYERIRTGRAINAPFVISQKRIADAVIAYKKVKPSGNVKVKIFTVFSRYLKKMKYREIRNAYGMELNKAA